MDQKIDKQTQRVLLSLTKAERTNDIEAQISGYLTLTHLIPEPAIAHARAASLLQRLDREQESLQQCLLAMSLDQNDEVDALVFPLLGLRAEFLQRELKQIHIWYSQKPNLYRRRLLTLALIRHEHFSEAENLVTGALETEASQTEIQNLLLNLAHIYHCQNRFHESTACCQIILENSPYLRDAHYMMAQNYNKLSQYNSAIQHYYQVLSINPKDIDTHHSLANLMLKTGNFQKGWEHWEWRWAKSIENQIQNFNIPEWNGQPIKGKRLLVWTEQGIGDQIMFASVLPDLCRLTKQISWECDARLVPLLSRSLPDVHFIEQAASTTGKPIVKLWPTSDYHIPAGSLLKILRNQVTKFPHQVHYLRALTSEVTKIRQAYQKLFPNKLLVGFSWRGGTSAGTNKYSRSLNLSETQPLRSLTDVQFINLQYGNSQEDLAVMKGLGLHIYDDPEINPLLNLDLQASQISALDLILTVDNTTAHLGGALGAPTYLLLSSDPDWRWGLETITSYWYPSVKLIRNPSPNEWSAAIEQAVELISSFHSRPFDSA